MTVSSWHILSLLGALAVDPSRPGFVVLHFATSGSGESGRSCQQRATNSDQARTLFRGYRTPTGELLTIGGHVALRFKPSTSARQIDSLISATGMEVFPMAGWAGCRRFAFRVVRPGDDALAIATALQQSGLVDYATPDLSAGRSEGVPSDSFLVDPAELSRSITRTSVAADVAPANYGMGQMLSAYTGPLLRLGRAEMAAARSSVSSSANALDLVRTHGLTALRIEIPERPEVATVRVMLYTLNGTPVRQLVSETLAAGQYMVGWDGLDDRGQRVQPGVYVAVMTAGSFHETHRLVVR